MAITKYATFEQAEVLDLKGAASPQHFASLDRISDFENYRTGDGFLYVRIRAISSRVNKNHDGWPSVELAGSPTIFERHHSGPGFTVEAAEGDEEFGFATFVGKPIFVDHHNSNPKKARGVIVDAKLNVLDNRTTASIHDSYWGGHDVDPEHLPPTEVELLLEVDAKSYPRLAKAIVSGDLDGFSMGCDVEESKCSHCGHIATNPDEYCSHILMKGAHHDFKTAEGKRVSRKSYENCYGIRFFEISAVFEPADETALAREVRAAVHHEAELITPGGGMAPDPLRGGQDQQVEQLAESYIRNYQMDPDTAWEMATQKAQQDQPFPKQPHGEGGSAEGYPKQWQYTPMPQAMEMSGLLSPANQGYQNDPRWSTTKTAENPLPQEFMTRAPEEIDTLRDEQLCPICGNDMDSETCQVCGYVSPPKEFDNPDLDQAMKIRNEMKEQEEQQAQPQAPGGEIGGGPGGGSPSPGAPGGTSPGGGGMATKAPATANVKSDMRWTPKVHPKTAARINQVERPITPSNPPVSDEPQNVVVTKDQTRPVTSTMATAHQLLANAQRNHGESMTTRTADGPTPPGDTSPMQRVDVMGVGGVDHATNEEASKTNAPRGQHTDGGFATTDVTGIGGVGVTDVDADSKDSLPTAGRESDDAGFNTDKQIETIPTKTYPDKDGEHPGVTDPVTRETLESQEQQGGSKGPVSNVRQGFDDKTLEQNEQQGDPVAQGGSAVQGVQPIDSVATPSYKRVNLLEHATTPDASSSGPTTTWSGTDGNGVLQQQPPVTHEDQQWGGVTVPVKLHTGGRISISAMRLAEAEVELGLISREEKWNRMAEVDALHPAVVQAKLEALAGVKTAGLNKLAQHRQTTRLPRAFGKHTSAPNGFERIANDAPQDVRQHISDDVLDAAFFMK